MKNPTPARELPALEKRINRKLLKRIIPIAMAGMFIAYLDRANLGVLAKPMSADLGLTAAGFGLAAGLFFIGYLVFEVPSNMALAKVGARLWISRIMVSWGIVTMLMVFVKNDFTLNLARILLGLAEAGFSPGIMLFLAFWYAPRALVKSYSLLNLAVPIALSVASVLTSSILLMHGFLGIAGWRWAFLLEGIPAIGLGAYIFFRMPSRPADASWLDESEKAYLNRVVAQPEDKSAHKVTHLLTALRTPSIWLFSLAYFCMTIGFWAITYFLPTIIQERFKLDASASGFVSAIPWLFSCVAMLVVARTVRRTGDRTWHLTGILLAGGVGMVVGATATNPFLALAGITVAGASFFCTLSAFQSIPAQIYVGGLGTVALAMINSLGNISGLVGPVVLGALKDATGSTRTGLLLMSGFFVLAAILCFGLSRWADRRTNGGPASSAINEEAGAASA